MTRKKHPATKASDIELTEAYARLRSVWKVAKEFGMCGQSVHERLGRLGVIKTVGPEFTIAHQSMIAEAYAAGFTTGDGVLDVLVQATGKSKQNICRWARRNGLTNASRRVDARLSAALSKAAVESFRKNGHPKGHLGLKHTEASKRAIAKASVAAHQNRTEEQEAARVLKAMKTKDKNGTLYGQRTKTTWKAGWREIGGAKKYYRSRWEANYARYLEWLRSLGEIAKWEHEPKTFWFEQIKRGTRSYLPDFRVTEKDGETYFVEVKGWMDDRSKTKLKRMAKYYPKVELRLVDSKAYRRLEKQLRNVVPGWE